MSKTNRAAKPSKTSPRKPTPSASQTLYALARATFETIDAEYKTAIASIPITREMTEADYLAACDQHDAIADRLGRGKAREAMLAAEDAMVRWSLEHAKGYAAKAAPEHAEDIGALYDRARRSSTAWPKLVDAAFRLAA